MGTILDASYENWMDFQMILTFWYPGRELPIPHAKQWMSVVYKLYTVSYLVSLHLKWCGPVSQRLSMEISGPAWCASSCKEKRVEAGKGSHLFSLLLLLQLVPSPSLPCLPGYSVTLHPELNEVRLGYGEAE